MGVIGIGVVNAVDNPTRQTFVPELVGPGMLGNAVSLNSRPSSSCPGAGLPGGQERTGIAEDPGCGC